MVEGIFMVSIFGAGLCLGHFATMRILDKVNFEKIKVVEKEIKQDHSLNDEETVKKVTEMILNEDNSINEIIHEWTNGKGSIDAGE